VSAQGLMDVTQLAQPLCVHTRPQQLRDTGQRKLHPSSNAVVRPHASKGLQQLATPDLLSQQRHSCLGEWVVPRVTRER
jgi:hypothetical protein